MEITDPASFAPFFTWNSGVSDERYTSVFGPHVHADVPTKQPQRQPLGHSLLSVAARAQQKSLVHPFVCHTAPRVARSTSTTGRHYGTCSCRVAVPTVPACGSLFSKTARARLAVEQEQAVVIGVFSFFPAGITHAFRLCRAQGSAFSVLVECH